MRLVIYEQWLSGLVKFWMAPTCKIFRTSILEYEPIFLFYIVTFQNTPLQIIYFTLYFIITWFLYKFFIILISLFFFLSFCKPQITTTCPPTKITASLFLNQKPHPNHSKPKAKIRKKKKKKQQQQQPSKSADRWSILPAFEWILAIEFG